MRFFRRAPKAVAEPSQETVVPQTFVPLRREWIQLTEEQRNALSQAMRLDEIEIPSGGGTHAAEEDKTILSAVVIPFENHNPTGEKYSPKQTGRFLRAVNGEDEFPIV